MFNITKCFLAIVNIIFIGKYLWNYELECSKDSKKMVPQHCWKAIFCYGGMDCIPGIWIEELDQLTCFFFLSGHFHPSVISTLRSRIISNTGSTNSHSIWTQLLFDSRTERKRGSLLLEPDRFSLENAVPVLSPSPQW